MIVVDYTDRRFIANRQAPSGTLRQEGPIFHGVLPEAVIVANTPTDWDGERWTQIVAPVSDDPAARAVLVAHELFHRIQPALGLTRNEVGNAHLDEFEGRYWLQLEWRALTAALEARTALVRRSALEDALAFRQARYDLFPLAAAEEHALEINEGVPEYTGVRLGLSSAEARRAFAVHDLSAFVTAPSFVRSFAYATGPAYGLLLDELDPDWKSKIGEQSFDALVRAALPQPTGVARRLEDRARLYDDGALRLAEVRRDEERRARLSAMKDALVDGPVLVLPLRHSNYQFNPQNLVPLAGYGVVYPTMRVTDDWGSLEVEHGGALVWTEGRRATVIAPADATGSSGEGWRLTLAKGWAVAPGDRQGDYQVVCAGECGD
ncbi:MAG: hypothetical protein EBR82_40715 [Caulobacteraceae bacterium]|nr:hypothetical protein [Caulobacteraceae bacterium]